VSGILSPRRVYACTRGQPRVRRRPRRGWRLAAHLARADLTQGATIAQSAADRRVHRDPGRDADHHLNAMEADGVVTRGRDPTNRRVHVVELTEAGEALFLRLRNAAVAFDRQLRAALNEEEAPSFTRVLDRLHANVASPTSGSRPAFRAAYGRLRRGLGPCLGSELAAVGGRSATSRLNATESRSCRNIGPSRTTAPANAWCGASWRADKLRSYMVSRCSWCASSARATARVLAVLVAAEWPPSPSGIATAPTPELVCAVICAVRSQEVDQLELLCLF
jgi:hypothetical protein